MSNLFQYQILVSGKWCTLTDPELWERVNGDEKRYFETLRERQRKLIRPDFFIPDQEPGVIPGEGIF